MSVKQLHMTIFDIDEMINDPWAGMRNTDAYINYVLKEAQKLLDSGELEEVSEEVFAGCIYDECDCEPTTSFLFDGREFTYLYYKDKIAIRCDEWGWPEWFGIKDGKICEKTITD